MDSRLIASSDNGGVARWLADHDWKAAARWSGDIFPDVIGITTRSTIERRYSSTLIPVTSAWAKRSAATSGLRFNVTVTAFVSSSVYVGFTVPGEFRFGEPAGANGPNVHEYEERDGNPKVRKSTDN